MKSIYKYEVPLSGEVTVPFGAKLLTVQVQGESIQAWFKVDKDAADDISVEKDTKQLYIIPTGGEFEDLALKYLTTIQLCAGSVVFHVFEDEV